MVKTYKGRKLAVKIERKQGRVSTWINGQLLGYNYGTTQQNAEKQLTILERWIDMADERRTTEPHAYPEHFYTGATAQ